MRYPHLEKSRVLVVEDEPLIALDITMAFEKTGAKLTTTNTLQHARILVEHDGISAAILDRRLPDGDCNSLCIRLKERGIPFLIYSGFPASEDECKDAPHIAKPASQETMLSAVEALIRNARATSV